METYKLCVSIPGKSLKIDMPRTDAEVWFTTLVDALLNNQPEPEPDEDQEDEPTYATLEDPVEKAAWAVPEEVADTQETAPP